MIYGAFVSLLFPTLRFVSRGAIVFDFLLYVCVIVFLRAFSYFSAYLHI